MMRILFGALLGFLVAYPTLAALLGAVVATIAVQPPVLAAALGIWAWPRITRTVRGWAA
jgi:ABC-type dipeptide/oligopeptide/nickel transport system permease subunit